MILDTIDNGYLFNFGVLAIIIISVFALCKLWEIIVPYKVKSNKRRQRVVYLSAAVELSGDGGDGDDAHVRTIHSTQFCILFHDSVLNLLQFQSLHARFRAHAIPHEPRS